MIRLDLLLAFSGIRFHSKASDSATLVFGATIEQHGVNSSAQSKTCNRLSGTVQE